MPDEIVLVGINPATRNCELTSVDDDEAWRDCRELGLIPIRVTTSVARKIFGQNVPCVDALLPCEHPQRAIFVHVVAPELGDGLFYRKAGEALHAIADLNISNFGDESVRQGLNLGEGEERMHVAIYWPED